MPSLDQGFIASNSWMVMTLCGAANLAMKKTHPKCFGKFTSTSDLNIVALAADLNSPVCIISADHPIALALW